MLLTLLHMQQISNCKAPFACNNQIIIAFLLQLNTNQQTTVRLQQNSNTLFRMKPNIKQHRPQAAIKQATLHKPCIYDK